LFVYSFDSVARVLHRLIAVLVTVSWIVATRALRVLVTTFALRLYVTLHFTAGLLVAAFALIRTTVYGCWLRTRFRYLRVLLLIDFAAV